MRTIEHLFTLASFRMRQAWRNLQQPVMRGLTRHPELKNVSATRKTPAFAGMTVLVAVILFFAAPASAQTPGQYCKTVSGCEVLDVVAAGGYGATSNSYPAVLLKYCKNGKLNILPLLTQNYSRLYFNDETNTMVTLAGHYSYLGSINDDDCAVLP